MDALRSLETVIATPEKFDIALSSVSSLIDDVGLIVLDEDYMIGPSEQDIRYETLVQRLLRRADSAKVGEGMHSTAISCLYSSSLTSRRWKRC